MTSRLRTVGGLALGLVLLAGSVGCQGKMRDERDSLWAQNQQLERQLAGERQRAADLERQQAALRANLAAVPATQPTNGGPRGLEGTEGVTVGRTAAGEDVIVISGDVLFDTGNASIKPAFRETLNRVAQVIQEQYPGRTIRVEGHTDVRPIRRTGWEDNWDLGAARARSVLLYLAGRGVPERSMYAASFAANRPVSPTDLARNRRVEIVVVNNPGR